MLQRFAYNHGDLLNIIDIIQDRVNEAVHDNREVEGAVGGRGRKPVKDILALFKEKD